MSRRHALSWMDDRLEATTLRALLDVSAKRDLPAWTGPASADERERQETLQDVLSDLVDGIGDETLAADLAADLSRWAPSGTSVVADPLAVTLARRTGTDMLAALSILALLDGMVPQIVQIRVAQGPARHERVTVGLGSNGMLTIKAPLAQGAQWDGDRLVLARGLPQTVLHALVGRDLAQVVSHPDLDPLGLSITRAEATSATETVLHVDHVAERRPLASFGRDELAADRSLLDIEPPRPRRAPVDTTPHF